MTTAIVRLDETIDEKKLRLRGEDGHFKPDARIDVGGTLFPVTRARQQGSEQDGNAVSFPTAYPSTPKVDIPHNQGIGYHPDFDGSVQHVVMKADQLDNQGFTLRAEVQNRSSSTPTTDSFPAGTLTSQGEALSLAGQIEGQNGGSGLSATAVDGTYQSRWEVTISVTDNGGELPSTSTLQVTVAVDKWDGDVGQWVETDTVQYQVTAASGGTDSLNKFDSSQFTDGDIESGDDVRVRVKDVSVNCGQYGCSSSVTVDPIEVNYSAGSTASRSMSPSSEEIQWIARQEVS